MIIPAYAGIIILFEWELSRDLLDIMNPFIFFLFFIRMLFLAYAGFSIFGLAWKSRLFFVGGRF